MTEDKPHHSNELATFKVDVAIPLARLGIIRLTGIPIVLVS